MPIDHLNTVSRLYPSAWKQVEFFISGKGKDLPDWPAWCFLPMAGWYSIVSAANNVDRITDLKMVQDVARLAAIGIWRYTQGIYRFDGTLRDALCQTSLSGDIPVDVLLRLPEWSIYIETTGMTWGGSSISGFWAHLESDANTRRRELRLLLNLSEGFVALPLHIDAGSVLDAVTAAFNESATQARLRQTALLRDPQVDRYAAEQIQPLLAMILYLCSDEPDVNSPPNKAFRKNIPSPKKVKGHLRLFPAEKPTVWRIGENIGQIIRQGGVSVTQNHPEGEGSGKSLRPHVRRAHWHGYWIGNRENKQFSYKWLAPILVSGNPPKVDI